MQLRKQMSVDGGHNKISVDGGHNRTINTFDKKGGRGFLTKQMSVEPNILSRQHKLVQVNLLKQMSMQSSMPSTPTGVRKTLDKRLKKEQGMTILVSTIN